MTPVFNRANDARDPLLREHLLAVTYRGDVQYLSPPRAGTFAVLDLRRGRKAFFTVPPGARAEALRTLIEDHLGAPVERVAEFVWAV